MEVGERTRHEPRNEGGYVSVHMCAASVHAHTKAEGAGKHMLLQDGRQGGSG